MRGVINRRILLPPDTYERHCIVAELVGPTSNVVDIGGVPGQLAAFLPGASVLVANVGPPTDIVISPTELPFADRSFDVVTSLDVLEHLAEDARARFISELARVAGRRVVCSTPLGTPGHAAAEREIDAWYTSLIGKSHPMLREHLKFGLPTLDECQLLLAPLQDEGYEVDWFFHGDYRATGEAFKRVVRVRNRRPLDILAYARMRIGFRPDASTTNSPGPYTNRMFMRLTRTEGRRSSRWHA